MSARPASLGLRAGVLALVAACAHPAPPLTPPAGACPEGMALVGGRFCIDRWEGALVEVAADGERAFSPYESPRGKSVRAVSREGVVPQGYISRDEADGACRASGKRLCLEGEWVAACRGDPPRAFPYGDQGLAGACNDSGISPLHVFYPEAPATYSAGPMNDPRLNQQPRTVARTGAFARCATAVGVFDMVGNLHEWVASAHPTFRGGYFQDARANGEGCAYRTTAHASGYHDYSTGFRCCRDPEHIP